MTTANQEFITDTYNELIEQGISYTEAKQLTVRKLMRERFLSMVDAWRLVNSLIIDESFGVVTEEDPVE